jgi:hypothetical protein
MITQRVWIAMGAVAVVIGGSAGCVSKMSHPRAAYTAVTSPTVQERLNIFSAETGPRIDLYGNEIEDAVTDYRMDSVGDVSERHARETDVPLLCPPIG